MDLTKILAGQKVLKEIESPVSGKLTVVKSITWGVHIMAGGLTQSGGIAELIWKSTLKKLLRKKKQVETVLILGLGGGGIAKLVRKNWPEVKITGVDIDPVIINLGKKYLNLDKYGVDVVITDAYKFLNSKSKSLSSKYDIICIDTYVGDEYPKKFESENFIQLVKSFLAKDGYAVFNRLYYGEKRKDAVKFGNKLEKVFANVEVLYPEANVMFWCLK